MLLIVHLKILKDNILSSHPGRENIAKKTLYVSKTNKHVEKVAKSKVDELPKNDSIL